MCASLAQPLRGDFKGDAGVVPAMAGSDEAGQLRDCGDFVLTCQWRLCFKGRWQLVEQINVLELRVLELLARWCASRPVFFHQKVFLFSDSQVVVAGLRTILIPPN